MRGRGLGARALACAMVGMLSYVLAGCGTRSPRAQQGASDKAASLLPLHAFEEARRKATDFEKLPSSEDVLGPNPFALRRLPGTDRLVGILRGDASVVVLDGALHELARLAAPIAPVGLAIDAAGEVLIVGEHASTIARYRFNDGKLVALAPIEVSGVKGLRDVAVGNEGAIYVLDEHEGRLITLSPKGKSDGDGFTRSELFVGHGPIRVVRTETFVVVDVLLDHRLMIYPLDPHGVPRADGVVSITHDGPIWSFDALEIGPTLVIAAGGVEDHPLDRRDGFFGYVDSFFFAYQVTGGKVTRTQSIDVSASSVITPKAIALHAEGNNLRATVVGYGGESLARIAWTEGESAVATIANEPCFPGGTSLALLDGDALAIADPLLDGWLLHDGKSNTVVPVAGQSSRAVESRLGEALFFTSLMSPFNTSEGAHSRFTCETCHFEGYVDGRTHHTGRGDVHATTKPLLGLFNNRPHFTRALDPDLTTVSHNEFRVASAKNGHDPWFTLTTTEHPWVSALGVTSETTAPLDLRRALMSFLMDFTQGPGPSRWATPRDHFVGLEQKGAELFRDTCATCHAARLVTDDAATEVPFARWESLVFADPAPIVWASAAYRKTGIVPYLHVDGARTVSLRRLWKKYPYFTNGSSKSLESVLDRARLGADGAFFHDATGATAALRGLDEGDRAALRAFLDLL